jgi:2',3'-cyclic-nucleotide 2'-phosphodiesterase (5'-nucleotidase family)
MYTMSSEFARSPLWKGTAAIQARTRGYGYSMSGVLNENCHSFTRAFELISYFEYRPGSSDPIGGVERFQTVMNDYRTAPQYNGLSDVITLFSGDVFNPSLESTVTKGQHMIPFLNKIGTDVACIGVCGHHFQLVV